MTAAREKGRLLKSGTVSARCESSRLASDVEQKSKEDLRAATSLSLESVSASLGDSGAAEPEILEQKRLLESAM